jgi:toxin ParE1/3/4
MSSLCRGPTLTSGPVRDHISLDSPRAADRVGRRLVEACLSLSDFPLLGRPGNGRTRGLLTVRPYVIVYRIMPDSVQILRIWRGRQARG